jgi:hypothetical protein
MTDISKTYTDDNGIIRWKSNDQIPFADKLEEFGLSSYEIKVHTDLRNNEVSAFIRDVYIPARENMTEEQKAEEAAERRAAFGPGEEVINVITGERFIT